MRTFTRLAVITAFLSIPFSSSWIYADVYRCVLDDGQLSYQQIPCHDDSEQMKLDHRRSGWSPLGPGENTLLNSYRKKGTERRRKPAGPQKKVVEESKSCWNKRKQLETIRLKMRRGYKLKESNELRHKRNNYEGYLRQFCS